jgi:N-carbamoylputrescine amidase
MENLLKIALVQQRCGEDRTANLAASTAGVRAAAAQGARLVLRLELHAGVYF